MSSRGKPSALSGRQRPHRDSRATSSTAGENVVEIAFRAGDAPLNRNPDFLYTLFVPARAHLAFPCFDQPDLKARYTLELTVPADWQAVANGAEIVARAVRRPARTIRYAETQPIPTYLFAFAAGQFQIETAERNGRTFRMFHRETDAKKVARNRDAVFDLHAVGARLARGLHRASRISSASSTSCSCPSFQFGGMEHPGAIFYNAGVDAARRIGDREPDARPREPDRARDRRTCGSAIW